MSQEEVKTWANLKPGSTFLNIFPDGKVPIVNIIPVQPSEDAPPCYYCEARFLSEDQIWGLAIMLRIARPEIGVLGDAIAEVRKGLPLNADHFTGVSSTDFAIAAALMSEADDPWSPEYDPDRDDREAMEDDPYDEFEFEGEDPIVLWGEDGPITDSELVKVVENTKRMLEGES